GAAGDRLRYGRLRPAAEPGRRARTRRARVGGGLVLRTWRGASRSDARGRSASRDAIPQSLGGGRRGPPAAAPDGWRTRGGARLVGRVCGGATRDGHRDRVRPRLRMAAAPGLEAAAQNTAG